MNYKFGPNKDFKIGVTIPTEPLCQFENWALMQNLAHAIFVIQEGSNVSLHKHAPGSLDEKYNYNNVWHLIKIEGTTWASWQLTFEGKVVFTIQESSDFDYVVHYLDLNCDEECLELFYKAAAKKWERYPHME